MATVLEEYITEEQRSFVRFLSAKEHNAKDNHIEMFLLYVGKCSSRIAVHNWFEKSPPWCKRFDEEVEMEVRKWLR
jgi:hypothetical protein